MRTTIPFGENRPDYADHGSDSLTVADGVYAAANGYKPVKQPQTFAPALSGTFKGAASFVASDGTARLIAGNATNLYRLSGGAWTSMLGSLTVNDRWRFTQFGDTVIACTGGAPVAVNLVAGTAASLGGSPPTADLCATVRDFVVLGRTAGANSTVTWSGQGSHTTWTVGTLQSGSQPLYSGGKVMGLTSGEYCLILQRYAVKRMSYTADPNDPWQFDEISTNYGCQAEGSVIQAGRMTFFYSDRGFAMCDGTDVQPIGAERVNNTFRSTYSNVDIARMWGAVDPVRTLAIWVMPYKLWMYNWTLDRWTVATVDASACFPGFSEAVTLEQLTATYATLESVPYSLDDPRFSGGEPRLSLVNAAGAFQTLSGANMAATFELPYAEYAGNQTARIRRVRPLGDMGSGLTLRSTTKAMLGGTGTESSYTQLNSRGDMPTRIAGRSVKLGLTVAAGTSWTYAQGLEIELAGGGRR